MRHLYKEKKLTFIALNIGLPLFIGGLLYYILSPDVLFVRLLDSFLPINFHMSLGSIPLSLKIIRNYAFDILWAYSLTVAMLCVEVPFFRSSQCFALFMVTLEVIMEMLQLMPGIYGTFDAIDIVVEVSTSILVIKILNAKERGYEKE